MVDRIDVCICIEQQLHKRQVPLCSSRYQRRGPIPEAARVNAFTFVQGLLDKREFSSPCKVHDVHLAGANCSWSLSAFAESVKKFYLTIFALRDIRRSAPQRARTRNGDKRVRSHASTRRRAAASRTLYTAACRCRSSRPKRAASRLVCQEHMWCDRCVDTLFFAARDVHTAWEEAERSTHARGFTREAVSPCIVRVQLQRPPPCVALVTCIPFRHVRFVVRQVFFESSLRLELHRLQCGLGRHDMDE